VPSLFLRGDAASAKDTGEWTPRIAPSSKCNQQEKRSNTKGENVQKQEIIVAKHNKSVTQSGTHLGGETTEASVTAEATTAPGIFSLAEDLSSTTTPTIACAATGSIFEGRKTAWLLILLLLLLLSAEALPLWDGPSLPPPLGYADEAS